MLKVVAFTTLYFQLLPGTLSMRLSSVLEVQMVPLCSGMLGNIILYYMVMVFDTHFICESQKCKRKRYSPQVGILPVLSIRPFVGLSFHMRNRDLIR